MQLIHRLKARYHHRIEKKYLRTIKRRQFNVTIAEDVIVGVKLLAASLSVPRYVIAEHLIQIGTYHVLKAIGDPEKRDKLIEHMVRVHLLGNELTDDEDMLRLE